MSDLTTWRKEFERARLDDVDLTPVVAVAPSVDVLDVEFDSDYGGTNGPAVLIWTEQRVYFPVKYDGAEWLGSAPRDPTGGGQPHVGGG